MTKTWTSDSLIKVALAAATAAAAASAASGCGGGDGAEPDPDPPVVEGTYRLESTIATRDAYLDKTRRSCPTSST